MKLLTSRKALLISVGIILVSGAANSWLDGQQSTFFRSIVSAYLASALHWVINLTPRCSSGCARWCRCRTTSSTNMPAM